MSYSVQNIRNVCLLGHGGNGKTALAESMLYLTGGTVRLGNPADGNTVCDYDPEEIRRQISISTAVAPVEYNGCKINVLDTPGYFDFSGEVIEALQVADAAIIVCSAKAGMSVGAEKAWKLCEQRRLPRLLYISKTDEENSDYNAAFDTLRERFGKNIAPVAAPIWDADKKVIGFIDVLHKRAFEAGPKGERIEIDVPDDKKPVLDELYDALKESVAETSEELMDKYFSGEDFTYAEMIQGLRQGVKDLSLFPVVCGSAVSGLGTRMLLDIIVELLPSPLEGRPLMGENADGEVDEFVPFPGALPAALVWKTVSDQYGKYSFVKVISGNLKPDMQLVNSRTGATEKLGRLYVMKGKKAEEVKELECGDIGAIGKMEKVKTGDTLSDPRKVVKLEPIPFRGYHPQDQGPGGQDRRRPHPPERGGSDLQLGQQRRNPPDGGLRHRRHADGRDSLPAEEPLRRGRRALRAPGALPREDPQEGGGAGPPQEADRRPRPVRRRVDAL